MIATRTRLNLGSGQYPLEGWTNVDAYTASDIEGDLFELEFRDVEEIRMSHVLEHISWRQTVPLLKRIRTWARPGAILTVEVPDIDAILARGTAHPLWFKYVYGDQSHDGEYHRAGFSSESLRARLMVAGWKNVHVRKFESMHKGREGMPCLEAVAEA